MQSNSPIFLLLIGIASIVLIAGHPLNKPELNDAETTTESLDMQRNSAEEFMNEMEEIIKGLEQDYWSYQDNSTELID
ncbi:hypothetical protein KR018_012263 [Drosophila ironensis]|nr:hypothetical protein KR018_012263 [Drosophila ironensis]